LPRRRAGLPSSNLRYPTAYCSRLQRAENSRENAIEAKIMTGASLGRTARRFSLEENAAQKERPFEGPLIDA